VGFHLLVEPKKTALYSDYMLNNPYISRRLIFEDRVISEAELLAQSDLIVVLAEPGAGKTELLKSFAEQLGVTSIRASRYRHPETSASNIALVVDALDEVTSIDISAIDALLVKASHSQSKKVVFASRSSEWASSRTALLEEYFSKRPTIVRLTPFSGDEQRSLFESKFLDEDFESFRKEVTKFDLHLLLGNPQFLILFGEAYLQSGRHFTSKRKIFADAVERLALEKPSDMRAQARPSISQIVILGEEIFAILLLSGATGFAMSERLNDRDFPYIKVLSPSRVDDLVHVKDTRLFKSESDVDQHEPVHRIVAEYCAACYLARRIDDPTDQLSLRRCFSIIAPNLVVRDELRGLLGWIASLGSKEIQEAAIDLDCYAVLANGDPSRLLASSKRRLLTRLGTLAEIDPYFRRADAWRTFSASGFFSQDVVGEIKELLVNTDDESHLRGLLLELLKGADVVGLLHAEISALMLCRDNSQVTRMLACELLGDTQTLDLVESFDVLMAEGSYDALTIACDLTTQKGVAYFGRKRIENLLLGLSGLYPKSPDVDHAGQSKYFISQFTDQLDCSDVEWFLDSLTENLKCVCGASWTFNCHCRNGISKILGRLLDRYVEASNGSIDPVKLLRWTRELVFHSGVSAGKSSSIEFLRSDRNLRQAVHRLALEGLSGADEIERVHQWLFSTEKHTGLFLEAEDFQVAVDYAFASGNVPLWTKFIAYHRPFSGERSVNFLRAHMREQAKLKTAFMKAWAVQNRNWKNSVQEHRLPRFRFKKKSSRRSKQLEEIHVKNLAHLMANRELIESGCHWGWLNNYAGYYLNDPEKLLLPFDDPLFAEKTLMNCLPFISGEVPTISMQLELSRQGQTYGVVRIAYAACLATFREKKSLVDVSVHILKAVKVHLDMHYRAVSADERVVFELEVNRNIFHSQDDVEQFAREYIEPQLRDSDSGHTNVGWLKYKPEFENLRSKLSFEWLSRFSKMPFSALDTLFDLCAAYDDKENLELLIAEQCRQFSECEPRQEDDAMRKERQTFWYIRSFCFARDVDDVVWAWLSLEPNIVLALERCLGRLGGSDHYKWPSLSAPKIYKLLDSYIEKWPKVYLPDHWGTGDPDDQTAYRFLSDSVWGLSKDDFSVGVPIIEALLADGRFSDFDGVLRNIRAELNRKAALQEYKAPTPVEVVGLLNDNRVASVEDLRALLVEKLEELQLWLKGTETDPLDAYYSGNAHVDENTARNRIVEYLRGLLKPLGVNLVIEHQLANAKRSDFTASTLIDGQARLLVVEIKGQWHRELYTAASIQLHERYSIHPDAAQQGIFLALWFGSEVDVAGRNNTSIQNADELRGLILQQMPMSLHDSIDVVVLDLSRTS
tara:strand:+ start:148 stop:4224 length:4077 start_codon:yes stop_codon:yes gene_type:complete